MLPLGDTKLVKILDTALADTARRSGDWLVCKPGCTQCCVGVFAIHQLDAARLEQGLQELSASDPERARSVRERAQEIGRPARTRISLATRRPACWTHRPRAKPALRTSPMTSPVRRSIPSPDFVICIFRAP